MVKPAKAGHGHGVWAEVSLGAVAHNLRAIRQHIGGKRKILAIVKADAYGHGAVEIARALERAGADALGATSAAEGAELREAGVRRPILVLTGFWPGEERMLLENRLTPCITDLEQLKWLERAAARRKAPRPKARATGRIEFHLKIDTGMNRLGVPAAEIGRFIAALGECRHLHLAGTFTHFAAAEEFTSSQTEEQMVCFDAAVAAMRRLGLGPGILHMANSAAIGARPGTWADMVRPGALLYGYHQAYVPEQMRTELEARLVLQPALALRARVISVKDLPAGSGIGYNRQFVAERPTRVAVLAAGYAEGVMRALRGRGRVILRGRCAPLVGTISMDLAMADVSAVPGVEIGDVATFFGSDSNGGCAISPAEVARDLGTVTSELLCAIGKRVPRYYTSSHEAPDR